MSKMKKVYQLDPSGFLVGTTEAMESPLEPGVYLVPGGCVEKAPPRCKVGEMPVYDFTESKWTKVSNTRVVEKEGAAVVISDEEAARSWRNTEIARSDIELNKAEDEFGPTHDNALAWRKYRMALRAMPEHTDFPSLKSYPKAPDWRR